MKSLVGTLLGIVVGVVGAIVCLLFVVCGGWYLLLFDGPPRKRI